MQKQASLSPEIANDQAAQKTVVVIPVFNEARFIGSVVLEARRFAIAVIVVDDGSTDSTALIAEEAGAVVLRHQTNMGKGAALNTAFLHVKNLPAEFMQVGVVVTMDGDGQHLCSDIPVVAAPVLNDKAEIVVGSRFKNVKSRIPRWRKFGQHALTVATNVTSGYNLTDSQSGFRAFSTRALEVLDFESKGFSVESEMQFLARQHGFRVVEVPIHVSYQDPPKRNPVRHAANVINGILQLIGQHRPLLFLGGGGLVLLIIGLIWGAWVVEIYSRLKVLAVGYALISVLLTILGSLGLFTGVMLHSIRELISEIKKAVEKSAK